MGIELGLTPDGRWDISTTELLDAAAEAGFSAVGLAGDRALADGSAEYLGGLGLRCHEVLALVVSDDVEATVASAEQLARAAAAVAADWVLTVFRSPPSGAAADAIASSAAVLAGGGAGMAVEFSPLGPVPSIPAGLEVVDLVERAGTGRAGLMIDSWHFAQGGSRWAELEAVPLDRIAYVQFADALEPESDNLMRETMNRRAWPGEGVLDLGRFAATLLDRGWAGLVSVEVLSRTLRDLPVPEFARRAMEATAPFWR